MGNTKSEQLSDRNTIETFPFLQNVDSDFEGKACYAFPESDPQKRLRYDGEWKNGKKNGNGTLYWTNGSIYQGQWSNDMMDGIGVMVLPGKLIYEGEFCENQFQGQGVLTWEDGKKYEGSWERNLQHGFGTLCYSNSDPRKRKSYKGNWSDGKKQGYGLMTWHNNARYEGNWVDGKRDGYGKHLFPTGQIYIGNWVNGKREGEGMRCSSKGDKYNGYWIGDKKCGVGEHQYAHGRIEHREYDKGELLSINPAIQSLQVLCIETIGRNDNLILNECKEILPPNLLNLVESYRKSIGKSQDVSLSQKFHDLLTKISVGIVPVNNVINDVK